MCLSCSQLQPGRIITLHVATTFNTLWLCACCIGFGLGSTEARQPKGPESTHDHQHSHKPQQSQSEKEKMQCHCDIPRNSFAAWMEDRYQRKPWMERRSQGESRQWLPAEAVPRATNQAGVKPAGCQQDWKSCYQLCGEALSAFLRHTRRLTSMNGNGPEAAGQRLGLTEACCSQPPPCVEDFPDARFNNTVSHLPSQTAPKGGGGWKLTKACVSAH